MELRCGRRVVLASVMSVCVGGSAGCGDATSRVGTVLVRDSAGTLLVETAAQSRFAAPWILDEEPSWSVGSVDGDAAYLLSRVEGAMQMPDGSILVANGGTNELRFYGPDAAFVRSEGREGEGPGEFEYLRALGRCRPDGFVAFDLNWQMNAYEWDGTFVEKTIFRAPDGVTPYELDCDPHGHFLILSWGREAMSGPREGFYASHGGLVLADTEGTIQSELGEHLVSERIGSQFGSRPHPAGRATVFALHDDLIHVGSGERFEIEVRGLDGSLQTLLRGPPIDLAITDSIKEAFLADLLARTNSDRRPDVRTMVAEWEWPPSFPAYTGLRVDAQGIVWALAYSAVSSTPQVWSLFSLGDGYLGDLELPPRHDLLEAGEDYLLVRTLDELDVERVVKLGLRRIPSST